MTKRMLIDATHAEETRVVVLDGSRLEDFDVETSTKRQLKGNIYLAKVVRVEPSLQAAFVEYGGNRHGFLAFGEIHPDYYQIPVADRQRLIEHAGRGGPRARRRRKTAPPKPRRGRIAVAAADRARPTPDGREAGGTTRPSHADSRRRARRLKPPPTGRQRTMPGEPPVSERHPEPVRRSRCRSPDGRSTDVCRA